MQQVECSNEEIGDPYKEEIVIVKDLPGVPGDDKYGKGDDNRQQLYNCVKEQVALIQAENKDQGQYYNAKRKTIIFRNMTEYF